MFYLKDIISRGKDMSLRRMTSGELTLARSIFENTIDYSKVWIHNEKYLPGQGERTAMTPNGEMYYPDAVYSSDYSSQTMPGDRETVAGASHLFIHEMMHVWQYQKGYAVKLRGLFSWAANYHYDLNLQSISSYSM
ncbi:type IV secretion protein Rhs [Escherichia coli]|nr:type IV secretion protein Rhs [Escherichia coli]MCJ2918470.1 type IV secretion protein Rhs [Escherichia coli]WCB42976.1 type IV secretion protein Rhs [Escherichia coli]